MTEKINLEKKSLARLMACQTLCMYYDENNSDKNISSILNAINENYVKIEIKESGGYTEIYKHKFVQNLINGVLENVKDYDLLINKLLDKQNTTETLDEVFLNCFRLACQEFKFSNVDKNLIINEYTDIVAEFYNGIYVNFANGIMENLAKKIREDENNIDNEENNKSNDKISVENSEKNKCSVLEVHIKDNKKNNKKQARKIITLKKK